MFYFNCVTLCSGAWIHVCSSLVRHAGFMQCSTVICEAQLCESHWHTSLFIPPWSAFNVRQACRHAAGRAPRAVTSRETGVRSSNTCSIREKPFCCLGLCGSRIKRLIYQQFLLSQRLLRDWHSGGAKHKALRNSRVMSSPPLKRIQYQG